MMDPATYLKDRCDSQITWFESKATAAKRWHQRSAVALAVVAAAIPVVMVWPLETTVQRVTAATLGAAVVVIQSVRTIKKWQEDWLLYRNAEETLRSQKMLYVTQTGEYAEADRDDLFVATIEKLLATFNGTFMETNRPTESHAERGARGHRAS